MRRVGLDADAVGVRWLGARRAAHHGRIASAGTPALAAVAAVQEVLTGPRATASGSRPAVPVEDTGHRRQVGRARTQVVGSTEVSRLRPQVIDVRAQVGGSRDRTGRQLEVADQPAAAVLMLNAGRVDGTPDARPEA